MRPEILIENYIEHPEPLRMWQIHRELEVLERGEGAS
jgi:hypothetical protein